MSTQNPTSSGEAERATTSGAVASSSSTSPQRQQSPHQSPTRTVRLTAAEQLARERANTPVRGADILVPRPRSNSRVNRYESPLDPDELRRLEESTESPNEVVRQGNEGQRITIRPLAGSAVGTIARPRIVEERPVTPKSYKQGPSHRKVRRWNNDRFDSLAAELASSSDGVAAGVLARAHQDAHLYRAIHDPKEHTSASMRRFMNEEDMRALRDQFFEGSTPVAATASKKVAISKRPLSAVEMMNRIDSRLRRVVVKACTNSYPATQVVRALEDFVVASFAGKKPKTEANWWKDLLLEQPTVTKRKGSDERIAQFFFDAEGSSGGFHRLLLHALCQFHGLQALSQVVDISIGEKSKARTLTVKGFIENSGTFRLLEHIETETGQTSRRTEEDAWIKV